jgi:GNAT superfamily N-acetyltransferase
MALGFVRPARLDEAGEITRVQLATWRLTHRRLVPQHILEQLDEGWITRQWRDAITHPPSPKHRVLVAVEQRESPSAGPESAYLVGFCASGPADEAALAPGEDLVALGDDVAAMTELMVEPRWGRRGHGSRLLAATADLWRADGFTTGLAWTFAQDPVGQQFLSSAGWAPDGTGRALDIEDLLVPQIRLHVALTPDGRESDSPTVTAM